jgi:uncharacterized hydrophobic protein (TIGR00271 family)
MDGTESDNPYAADDARYPTPVEPPPGSLTKIIIYGLGGVVLILMVASEFLSVHATEELIGFFLVAIGVIELVIALIRHHELRYLAPAAMAILVGLVLIVWPNETLRVAGLALGTLIIARGALDVWAGIRRWHAVGTNSWVLIRGLIAIVLGVFVLLFPAPAVEVVVILTAVTAILRAVITMWFVVTHHSADARIAAADTSGIITYWMTLRDLTDDESTALEDTVFLFRGDRRARLWRFGIFMGLATTIATFGIATDSTAVVIGAMLIAPLMSPILGLSAGLINGRSRSAALSGLIALGGIVGSVAIAWLLSAAIPNLQTVIANGQVTARTAPNLLDLAIAIAAGAAGAYGVSRIEVSDALPGVAVAIALVPPLAVVGITLRAGDLGQASGAALLFLTNLFSIILMAGLVFLLVGYGEWSRLYERKDRIRTSFAIVALGAVLVVIPLALTGQTILKSAADLRNVSAAVHDWLGDDSEMRVNEVTVDGDNVRIQLIGPSTELPAEVLLYRAIEEEVGRPMTTRVAWVEEHIRLER